MLLLLLSRRSYEDSRELLSVAVGRVCSPLWVYSVVCIRCGIAFAAP